MSTGKVIQVIGPVVDAEFPPGQLPNIYNALKVIQDENKAAGTPAVRITLEVALHLGENRVRAIAMSTTVEWMCMIPGRRFPCRSAAKHWGG
jgi:F-type H+/Na+-transporting ATPase subunit beta